MLAVWRFVLILVLFGSAIRADVTLSFPTSLPGRFVNSGFQFQPEPPATFDFGLIVTTSLPQGAFINSDLSPFAVPAPPGCTGNTSAKCTLPTLNTACDDRACNTTNPHQQALITIGSDAFTLYVNTDTFFSLPARNVDLAIQSLEVVQAVQTELNDVPWVANKRTLAKVNVIIYAAPDLSPVKLPPGNVRLHGFRNNKELPNSPRKPANGWSPSDPYMARLVKRDNEDCCLKFVLPPDWTAAGDLQLMAEFTPPAGVYDPNPANNTRTENVTFKVLPTWPASFQIGYLRICFDPGENRLRGMSDRQPDGGQYTLYGSRVSGSERRDPIRSRPHRPDLLV